MVRLTATPAFPCLAKEARNGAPPVFLAISQQPSDHAAGGRMVITKISVSLIRTGPTSPEENREAQVTVVTVPTEVKGEPAPALGSKKERLDWAARPRLSLIHCLCQRSRIVVLAGASGKVGIPAIHRRDRVTASFQRRGRKASRAANQRSRPQHCCPIHERDGFSIRRRAITGGDDSRKGDRLAINRWIRRGADFT
jgi:hypothetical protein